MRAFVNGRAQGSIIDMQDEQLISGLRRAVGGAFAVKNLLDYEHDVDVTAAVLIEKILKSRTIDLFDTIQRFQIDFLNIMAFSENPDYLNSTIDVLSLGAKERLTHWIRWQAMATLEHLIFKPPYLGTFMKASVPIWVQMANQKLQNRLATEKSGSAHREDLLQKYIDAGEKHKDTVKPEIVRRMVSSTIAAGFDTTAFTMTAMIYYLLKNPETFTKLQQELETGVARGQLSNPPKYLEAANLRYLSAVLKEAMRCYPFLAVLLERVVPAGGAPVAGTWLPGGTVVGCHPVLVHEDRNCFGEDVDVFRPERWLTDDAEKLLAMERASLGFGSGKRACLGRHIAELEIKKVIPALLLKFKVSAFISSSRLTSLTCFADARVKLSLVDPQAVFESADNLTSFPKPIMVTFEERP